jgi:hypothetical protein
MSRHPYAGIYFRWMITRILHNEHSMKQPVITLINVAPNRTGSLGVF